MNYRDVELLDNSMRYAGAAFNQQRQEADRQKQLGIENSLRQRALDTADARTKIEDKRYTDAAALGNKRLDEGQTEAWLTGDDGGLVQYKGSPQGLQSLRDQAAAKGAALKITSPPGKKANIGHFTTTTPFGELTFNINTPEEADHVLGYAKQIGGKNNARGEFQTRETRNTEYEASLRDLLAMAQTPQDQAAAQRKLDTFLANKDSGRADLNVTEHHKEIPPREVVTGEPGTAEKGSLFWKTPATPSTLKTNVIPGKAAFDLRRPATAEELGRAPRRPTIGTPKVTQRIDGKTKVTNPQGVVGWATVDPNNLPEGYQLAP